MNKAANPVATGEISQETTIPWSAFVKFLSQFSHDIRNGLNAVELELTLATELCTDPDAVAEIRRARKSVGSVASKIQDARGKTSVPVITFVTYKLTEFAEDLEAGIKRKFPELGHEIHFENVPKAEFEVDPTLLITAFNNLLENSLYFRKPGTPVVVRFELNPGEVVFQLVQQVAEDFREDVSLWGTTPLISTRRAGYGLGLYQTKAIIEAHEGRIDFEHNPEDRTLAARVFLPCGKSVDSPTQ